MFSKPEIEFEAQIREGAPIGHDFGYFRWPDCKAPGNKDRADDPAMKFSASLIGDWFELRAPGYGEKSNYGNGSIHASSLTSLIVSDKDKGRVLNHLRKRKQEQIEVAAKKLAELAGEMESLR